MSVDKVGLRAGFDPPVDEITRKIQEQIRQEWMDAGMTPEEWERGERAAVLLDYMLAAGIPDAELAQQISSATDGQFVRLELQYIPTITK